MPSGWPPVGRAWSPSVVSRADKILELIGEEYLDVKALRNRAASRHEITDATPLFSAGESDAVRPESKPQNSGFAGTFPDLATAYQTNKKSLYHRKRFNTRRHYDKLISHLVEDIGPLDLVSLKGSKIDEIYDGYAREGKIATAHAMVGMLRTIIHFGANEYHDDACERLSVILHSKRYKVATPRSDIEPMTADYARAIIEHANEMQMFSIADAQAFLFDCKLSQVDVIGDGFLQDEPGEPFASHRGEKWLRGLLWSEIDKDMILRHPPSRGGKVIEMDLKAAPLVMAHSKRFPNASDKRPRDRIGGNFPSGPPSFASYGVKLLTEPRSRARCET